MLVIIPALRASDQAQSPRLYPNKSGLTPQNHKSKLLKLLFNLYKLLFEF